MPENVPEPKSWFTIPRTIISIVVSMMAVIVISMAIYPQYGVYAQRKEGEALLAHAQYSKEVAVAEAKAKMESASLLAEAEVTRAGGVARANKIIGDSLKENEAYLRYLWVNNLENTSNNAVIYIPTEAGMPIMEAGHRSEHQKSLPPTTAPK